MRARRGSVSAPAQHSGISRERWEEFSYDQQILMIANEMHRAARLIHHGEWDRVHLGLERVLQLTDLTISCVTPPSRAPCLAQPVDSSCFGHGLGFAR